MKRPAIGVLFLLVGLLASCGKKPEGPAVVLPPDEPRSSEKPKPPLDLPAPPAPSAVLGSEDLQKVEAGSLSGRALAASEKGEHARAVQLQHWAVARTGSGQYNLACFYSLNNQADPALYWLQEAALSEGVDVKQAQHDDDFRMLRRDPRWLRVAAFLKTCNQYWAQHAPAKTVLILPKGYQKGQEITAIVWLHGMGSHPGDFVNEKCQPLADRMNVAFVGVSGTQPTGPTRFVWAEHPSRDAARIADAMKEVSDRLTVKRGHVITLGFSQGAGVGLEVAVRNPEKFAGSIVMSSGCQQPLQLNTVNPSPLLARRGFVLTCGAREAPGNIQQTMDETEWLRQKARATKVQQKLYPGVQEHAFPPDFDTELPNWVKFIEQAQQ